MTSWRRLGSVLTTGAPLGASRGVLNRLGHVLEASWSILGESWSVLKASWRVLSRKKGARDWGRSRFAVPRAAGNRKLSKKKKKSTYTEQIYTELYSRPYNARRYTAGRLRARCGSKARQSGEPATALALKNNQIEQTICKF